VSSRPALRPKSLVIWLFMDLVKAIENYVDKIVKSVDGLKVLLVDEETVHP